MAPARRRARIAGDQQREEGHDRLCRKGRHGRGFHMEEVVAGRRGRHGEGRRQQENPSKFTYEERMGNRRRYTHVTPAKRP